MIDKLDLRIPAQAPYTEHFSDIYAELRNDPRGPFRASQHYLAAADLRPYGFDVVLHTHCKHGEGNHKLELIDTGMHSLGHLANEIRRIFFVSPFNLALMRVDLAADIPDVPVTWFLSQLRAKYKRFHNAMANDLAYQQLGQKGIQTLYFGKRPNCFRIYDKIAEWNFQHRRLIKNCHSKTDLPDFESLYGHTLDSVLTRVERQIGGGRIPEQITTLDALRRHAADFNPFSNLNFTQATPEPQPTDFSDLTQYLAVMHARDLVRLWGKHAFCQWFNLHSNRNLARWLKKYGMWLGEIAGITPAELYDRYRDSVSKQIAA